MTREEAKEIFLNRGFIKVDGGTVYDGNKWRDACIVISEWLKEEPVLDKIRAEIEQVKSIMNEEIINHDRKDLINFVNGLNQSLVIIDKYKAESEEI